MRISYATSAIILILLVSTSAYLIHNENIINHNSIVKEKSTSPTSLLWEPVVSIEPRNVSVGDVVTVYVDLVYHGNKSLINPFKIRSYYTTILTVYDESSNITYTKSILHYNSSNEAKSILFKPGYKVSLGYMELFFTKPGTYRITAIISGPNISKIEINKQLIVKPGSIIEKNSTKVELDSWIMIVNVSSRVIDTNDNLTVHVTLKYTGNKEFNVIAKVPLIKMIRILQAQGQDYWSIAVPYHSEQITIKPGYTKTFEFNIGPNATFNHKFKPGIYRIEVLGTGYMETGNSINLIGTLFIQINTGG